MVEYFFIFIMIFYVDEAIMMNASFEYFKEQLESYF